MTPDEVLARLTLEEKLAMLHQWSPAVPRLGLSAFRTGAEVLHGVAWLGAATVFPQPVGMAASWDPDLLRRLGAAVADELLAKHAADPTISRNVWAPVVDPLRHPLWGRNEEGFSEDPHLTAELATGYASGLRGDDPDHWRTVPTLKHLLAYNAERDRDVLSMQVPDRVLHEYELPAFAGPLRAGVAGAVMPAYNLVNGRPAHTSRELIEKVRTFAPEEILVVSDAGAPSNLVASQAAYPDDATAHAAALLAGTDSFTDHDADATATIAAVREALDRGLITEPDIDRAVRRVLITRARVDSLEASGGPGTTSSTTELIDAHAGLAREAARAAVVLLTNDGGTLPLRRDPAVIAVVGPLADRVLPDWYAGEPVHTTSVAVAAAQRWPDAEMRVVDGADHLALRADGRYLAARADDALTATGQIEAAARLAVTDWGWGVLTIADLATGLLWSADGRGVIRASASRPHGWVVQESFRADTADDGTLALRHLGSGRWLRLDAAGRLAAAADDVAEAVRFDVVRLQSGAGAAAQAASDADLVICALGNDPHLLGRETQDRPALELPPSQRSLWDAVRAAAPDAVLALISSYPYAFEPDARALLWTAHSQAVGHGVIDVVAGDAEPSGRLPQTWWRSTADAGELTDYDIVGGRSTYWYADAEPLFPLGHGLTCSTVGYRDLEVSIDAAGEVSAVVTVSNDGDRSAVEVVQVYTDAVGHRKPFPHRLGGYARVALAPGESAAVPIAVPRDRFSVWDGARGALTIDPGRYRVSAGPNARTAALVAEIVLDGEVPVPHRLPLRAAAFDERHAELVAETAEQGTAVAGPGWIAFDDVDGLDRALMVRVRRTGPGPARLDLQTLREGAWHTFAKADVPDDGWADDGWADVDAVAVGDAPPARGALRAALNGQVALAMIA